MPTLGVSTSGSRANRPTATPSHLGSAIVTAVDRVSDRGEPLERVLDAVGQLAPLDVCLVIDDVHELPPGSTAAELLGGLVARLPPHVHLVLAGRSAPPISLDLRRAAGEVIDIRIDELAFTATEVDALVRSVGRDPRTEHGLGGFAGWPSLVRLALSAPDGSAPQFLWEEIVASLPVAEQRLLLALATLGWGTASDVAWVAGVGDGGCDPLVDARLESLARVSRWSAGTPTAGTASTTCGRTPSSGSSPTRNGPATRRRALGLFQRRQETLRTGWSALRWGDAAALQVACRCLVHDTAGALPVDTAARWLGDAPEEVRDSPDLRLLRIALHHARDYDDLRLDGELDKVIDEYVRTADHNGAVVALVLGMAIAHMRGDLRQVARRRRAGANAAWRRRRPGPALPAWGDARHDRLAGRRSARLGGGHRGDLDGRRVGADQRARRPPARQHAVPVREGRRGGAGGRADARLAEPVRPHPASQGALAGG